jgi:DNA methylase
VRYLGTVDLPLAGLAQFPGNARRGDLGVIRASVARHGQYRSIVVRQLGDGSHVIVAGNHTALALAAEGHETARADLIDCDEDEARRINLADNRSAELGGYDDQALAVLLSSLDGDFGGTGWAAEDLAALLRGEPESRTDPDDVPEPPAEPVTRPGDVWLLGPHRLLCGDSFAVELPACDALISDPPYGMQVDTSWYGGEVGDSLPNGEGHRRIVRSPHKHRGAIEWDQQDFDPAYFAAHSSNVALFGANYYCTRLPEPGSWWVWDKRATADGGVQKAWGMPFELIWLKGDRAHRIIRHLWAGFTRKAEGADRERLHPTQKPVAVMRELVEYLTTPGQTVLDPFAGSGSTLIAAHQTGRDATLIEQDPAFCDVICRRFEDHTGVVPELVGRASVAV